MGLMGTDNSEDKLSVRRSSGKVEELSPEQLEQINYERKVRDQESTGHLITPKQVNTFAAFLCVAVLIYALPRIFLADNEQESTYIPLSERDNDRFEEEFYDSRNSFDAIDTSTTPAQSLNINQNPAINLETEAPVTEQTVAPQPSPETLALLQKQKEVALKSEVIDSVQAWASKWSAQDVDGYLSHYSSKFVSDKGMKIDEWRSYRSGRVSKPTWVQVMLLDIDVEIISESLVQVQFTQNYSASNYQDVSQKSLSLEKSGDSWKILTETSVN